MATVADPDRIKDGCQRLMGMLEYQVLSDKLTDPEALAVVATVLGLLLATTPPEHRNNAKLMTADIMNQILEAA